MHVDRHPACPQGFSVLCVVSSHIFVTHPCSRRTQVCINANIKNLAFVLIYKVVDLNVSKMLQQA